MSVYSCCANIPKSRHSRQFDMGIILMILPDSVAQISMKRITGMRFCGEGIPFYLNYMYSKKILNMSNRHEGVYLER